MKRLLLLAVASFVVLGAAPAWAQKPSAAFTREFQAGVDAFRLGEYDAAARHLTAASGMEPKLPGPHRFLAAVAAAQQRWADCITSARTAIELNPLSGEIVATRKLHDDCREADGRPAFAGDYGDGGAIAVTANVAGATVTVGGLKYGATPLAPRALTLGETKVSVSKAGWKTAEGTVTILPGVVSDIALTLEEDTTVVGPEVGDKPPPDVGWLRLSVPAGAVVHIDGKPWAVDDRGRFVLPPGEHTVDVTAPGRVPARRTVRVSKGQETAVAFDLESQATRAGRQRTGRVAMVAAVSLGAIGAMTGIMSIRARDEAQDAWQIETDRPTTIPLSQSTLIQPLRKREEIQALVDRSKRWGLVSNISYGAAAAALGVGVYMLARSSDERTTHTTIGPVVGDGWGVAVSGVLP